MAKTAVWLDISNTGGSLGPGASNIVTISINMAAKILSAGAYSDTITFSNSTSGIVQTRAVTLNVSPQVYSFPLDTDPGWARQGQWAFGQPTGQGGADGGYPDPTSGATGTNVFGVNLNGDYSTAIGGPYYLTAGPFNFAGYIGTTLQFQRWLNSDYPDYVYATIDVSNDGTNWTQIFSNQPFVETADASWAEHQYDLSAVADNQATVYVRWGYQVGSGDAYAYSGWNIDDIEFLAAVPNILTVTIPATATEGDGVLVGKGSVSVTPIPTTNLIVTLTSSYTAKATVPPTATILAGQTNVVFDIAIVDNDILDGTQTATITASASGYVSGSANIAVADNETAALSVVLPPSTIEGAGTVTGQMFVSAAPATNVIVTLSSSDTTELVTPATTTILAGQTSAVFVATVVDDTIIDGPQNVTVTAHVTDWTDGSATITVLDNENHNLTVVLPAQVAEGDGVITNGGSVGISGTLSSNIVVSLSSSDTSKLVVPAMVTIPAGQTNATFNLSVIDNTVKDGSHSTTVTASAVGFTNGTASVTILDNDPDHFTFAPIASPQLWTVPFTVTITASDVTNGMVAGFRGPVTLTATGKTGVVSITLTNSGMFTAGQWSGPVAVSTLDSNVVLTASFNGGAAGSPKGSSNPFNMVRPAPTSSIPVTNRVDMVPDATRQLLYITAGDRILRYDLANLTFLTPYVFSGSGLRGIDISPDNNTLVVADGTYSSTSLWVYVVNLSSGTSKKAEFSLVGAEAGTWTVAFGNDGAVLITSWCQGSGTVPLRRYDPATGNAEIIATINQGSMLGSSGDGHIIGVAEANSSAGPVDRYDVSSRTISGTVRTGWFTREISANRDGTQFAVPTYDGTFIYDGNLAQIALLGTYGSEGPIALAYHPQGNLLFVAWWPTIYVRAYELHTFAEVARYDCQYAFNWIGNWGFEQGRVRASRDGSSVFVTTTNSVVWIFRGLGLPTDLAMNMAASPGPVFTGSNLTYTITVTNNGPNAVTDAQVFDRLPLGVSFVSVTPSQGSSILSNGLVTCTLGTLSSGGGASINVVVTPPTAGIVTNTAAIYSSASDPNPTNNWAQIMTSVRVNPPTLVITSPPADSYVTDSTVTVTGLSAANSGVSAVTVNGLAASTADGYSNWTAIVSGLLLGTNTLTAIAADNAVPANTTTNSIYIIYAAGSYDGNGDGLPDLWQIQYFGCVGCPQAAPGSDLDGDGMNNLQEYLAGTNPTDPNSRLRITAITLVGLDVRVYFTSAGGKYYSLQRSNLMGGAWTNILTDIPGADGVQWVKDIGGAARTSVFYRIQLSQLGSPPPDDSDGDGVADAWAEKYFGHPTGQTNDLSCASCDPDGDGLSNLQEYLAGTDPTNAASAFRITSVLRTNKDLLITWMTGSGKTNALQAVAGTVDGSYSTNGFTDIFTVTNTVGNVTNYLDAGAATNFPSRFYRVRVVP